MKETKNLDKWIGILSISIVCIVAIFFVLVVSDTHLAKGTYGVDSDGRTYCSGVDDGKCYVCNTGVFDSVPTAYVPDQFRVNGYTCKNNWDRKWNVSDNGDCYDWNHFYVTENAAINGCEGKPVIKKNLVYHCIMVQSCVSKPTYVPGEVQTDSNGKKFVVANQDSSSVPEPSSSALKPSSSCEKLNRGAGCYTCGLGTSAATTNYHDSDPDKDKCKGTERCNFVGATCAGTSTGITPKTVVLKNEEGTSNNGSFLVDRNNNQITSYNPIKNCGTWSTTPCANSDCNTGASAQDSAYSGLGVGKTYTGPAVLYCKAGTSQGPNDPTPGNPSSTPGNPSSTPGNPSSDTFTRTIDGERCWHNKTAGTYKMVYVKACQTKDDFGDAAVCTTKNDGNVLLSELRDASNGGCANSKSESTAPSNPPTGTTGIIIAWIIGLFAIGYSFWYFKRTSTN